MGFPNLVDYKPTLCWNCANSVDQDKCPWVRDFTPVPGWDATPTIHAEGGWQEFESYIVHSCPLFKRDAYKGGMRKVRKVVKDEHCR